MFGRRRQNRQIRKLFNETLNEIGIYRCDNCDTLIFGQDDDGIPYEDNSHTVEHYC